MATPLTAPFKLRRVGAWSMRAGLLDPGRWVDVAARVGLDDVSLCGNAQTFDGPFEAFLSPAKTAAALRAYSTAGVAPHVMLWPRPETAYTQQMLAWVCELRALCPDLVSVDLDAEEQWTRSPSRQAAGAKVAAMIRAGWPKGLPLGVNGITAALPKILDLVAVADEVWPQAYTSTRTGQTSTPGDRQLAVATTWAAKLRPDQKLYMGLAAYNQEGAGGLSARDALERAAYAAASRVERIRYWSLQDLTSGHDAAFVRELCARCAATG